MIGYYCLSFENTWVIFILSNCTENWISHIGVGYIIPKITVYVEIWYDITKKCIKRLSSFFIVCNCFITFFQCYAFSMGSLLRQKRTYSFPTFSIISSNIDI